MRQKRNIVIYEDKSINRLFNNTCFGKDFFISGFIIIRICMQRNEQITKTDY